MDFVWCLILTLCPAVAYSKSTVHCNIGDDSQCQQYCPMAGGTSCWTPQIWWWGQTGEAADCSERLPTHQDRLSVWKEARRFFAKYHLRVQWWSTLHDILQVNISSHCFLLVLSVGERNRPTSSDCTFTCSAEIQMLASSLQVPSWSIAKLRAFLATSARE